jgi:tricorn protease
MASPIHVRPNAPWGTAREFPVLACLLTAFLTLLPVAAAAQDARLLREPTLSAEHIAFAHGGDLWLVARAGGEARRLTSTSGVDSDPHLSPDGRLLAFSSNRSGEWAVYVMPVAGGDATRLSWYPASAFARGWSADGSRVLFSSNRETAPLPYHRLWSVAPDGGPPELVPAPFAYRGSYAPGGRHMVIERVNRLDEEWRGYRGGQNTPLVLLDLETLEETHLPNERTIDIHPVWMDGRIYFLSDRDSVSNVWSFDPETGDLTQITRFREADVKTLAGHRGTLVFEQDGWIHTLDIGSGGSERLSLSIRGDFPWAVPRWVDAGDAITAAGLSATGRRAVMQARGEIFTVPVEHGSVRNLTRNPGAANRAPVWSPEGERIAWFSDDGSGYRLLVGTQDGLAEPMGYDLGESRMGWTPAWSPDGSRIAFVDDRLRIRVLNLDDGRVTTVDTDGVYPNRSAAAPDWSPDSRWLAYSKAHSNHLRRIVVWSVETGESIPVTDAMANAISPAWDRDGRHLWFLASTDLGRAAGWANTSAMTASPTYSAYVTVLREDDPTPFFSRSDEEPIGGDEPPEAGGQGSASASPAGAVGADPDEVRVDFEGIERRIVPLPVPVQSYTTMLAGPERSVFIAEQVSGQPGLVLRRFSLDAREAQEFVRGVSQIAVSADGSRILFQQAGGWRVVDTARPPDASSGRLNPDLQLRVDPREEWRQIFEEAWRFQPDYFYDPDTHGADWTGVRERYEPLLDHVRHRHDLNYILAKVSGELSVSHSIVVGGDLPETESPRTAALGADLVAEEGRWRIARIYTHEAWNPNLNAPLDRPGIGIREGEFLLAVDGVELTAQDDPYRLLEGTRGRQVVLHIHDRPTLDGAREVTVEPIASEVSLRQQAWVEDNRRRVDELSGGRLAYLWVPNTVTAGVASFDRYYFSQQDREGAVVDVRFNSGGLLDDYMVDLMSRELRAAITNEAEGGSPMRLPAGILGPKVMLINERSASGGDYLPWVFRKLEIGPLIGTRTWGGLVAGCSPYAMKDGGFVASPCNAVFEPGGGWVGENEGIPPDIEVLIDARSAAEGRDPQLARAVREALDALERSGGPEPVVPPHPTPARRW